MAACRAAAGRPESRHLSRLNGGLMVVLGLLAAKPISDPIPIPIPNPKPSKPYFKPKTYDRFN